MNKPKPVYLLAGGDWRRPGSMLALLKQVLGEAKSAVPRVAYLGAASGDNAGFYWALAALLKKAGGTVERVRLAHARADVPLAKKQLRDAEVIFVSGGDVEEGMRWLKVHGLIPFLRDLHRQGKVFFGLSAGSIMLGTQWVRWEDPEDDATAELFDCLGIAPLLCDTHAEGDDWEELKMALSLRPGRRPGFGIPTQGALRITPGGRIQALVLPVVRMARQTRGVEALAPLKPL